MQSPSPQLPVEANEHFINALIDMSSEHEIEVSEDVYSHNGIKLLSRGTKVCPKLYGRVVNHKLLKPIETSLTVANLPDLNQQMVQEGERLMDEMPFVKRLCGWSRGRVTALGMLAEIHFTAQAKTLMAVSGSGPHNNIRHNVLVALIAMGLANAMRYNDPQLLATAAQAGVFHDVGEMYVDPAIIASDKPLSPREWMTYGGHAIIGAALAREIAGFEQSVQRAVLEHHERLDGFGYPRSLQGNGISLPGRIVGTAETLSALLLRPLAMHHIDIALKIMPHEYEPEIVSIVGDTIHECGTTTAHEGPPDADESVVYTIHEVFLRIAQALTVYEDAQAKATQFSGAARTALQESFERFVRVQRAFTSTGIAGLAEFGGMLSEEELRESRFEASCVLSEVAWRMLKLSRELCLKAAALPAGEAEVLMHVAEILAGPEIVRDTAGDPALRAA